MVDGVITAIMQIVPGAVGRSLLGIAAVPCGELRDPGRAQQREIGCAQPAKGLGVDEAGD